MHRRSRLAVFGLALALVATALPAFAARALLDYHRLDADFALYAREENVPWKPASVRLDTYTSAPVQFAVYSVDPAAVIVAGSTTRPRAVDTNRLRAIARWRYVPPGGYRFQSNDVSVPLGTREGFFLVEARRGGVGEQVWINRTRIGLLSKETPGAIRLFGTDLGSGKPLARMRVSFIVNRRFVDRLTDRHGILVWTQYPRPVFAMAQFGAGLAFISFLPQAPLPATIVAIKTGSAVVHAGDALEVVGFARSRTGTMLRAASGIVNVTLRSPFATVAQTAVRLDGAGAFAASLHVPPASSAGEYTAVAAVNGGAAATTVHVDANAAGLSLAVAAQCQSTCDPDADLPLVIRAMRDGAPAVGVRVVAHVIRSPHVYAAPPTDTPWGVTAWSNATVTTASDGRALIEIPHPTDGLASTYGVRITSGGATADTRIAVPTSRLTLRVHLDRDDVGSGTPASFDVDGNDVTDAKPAGGIPVRVQLVHGSSVQQQMLTLDDRGRAHGVFSAPQVGSNLVVASAANGERAMDAAQLEVEPQTMQAQSAQASAGVRIVLDRNRYAAGDEAHVTASLPGAQGSALLTLESAAATQVHIVPVHDGEASATVRIGNAAGELAIGAAFVRDGSLEWTSVPLVVDAPGRPLNASLALDRNAYSPGASATANIDQVRPGEGTLFVRITKDEPTGSALFSDAPDLLAIGTTVTQDTAVDGASWHPWVDSTGDHAVIQTFVRRSSPPADLTMTQADTANVYWTVVRDARDSVHVPVPMQPGKYVLSLLKVDDDGRVTAASGNLVVQ